MPEMKRYVEIRAFFTAEAATRHVNTPSSELKKAKTETGLEGIYYVYSLDEALKRTEQLLIGFQLEINFVLWEAAGPVYTKDASMVRHYFLA